MKIGIILNKKSGAKSTQPGDIAGEFQKHHCEVLLRETGGEDLASVIEDLAAESVERIVVSGGDGTISAVAALMAGKDIPLGILPGGTFNNFAKDTGIPLALEEAVALTVTGKEQAIDVGEVNGTVFINNSSVGLYPHAVHLREKLLARWGGTKWIVMLIAGITVFRRFPLFRVSIGTEKDHSALITPFVFVGNNEYHLELFNLGRRTRLTDGKLSLYTANVHSRSGVLKLLFLTLVNKVMQDKNFHFQLVEAFVLHTDRRKVRVSIDGEIVKMAPPIRYKIRPAALKVILPSE